MSGEQGEATRPADDFDHYSVNCPVCFASGAKEEMRMSGSEYELYGQYWQHYWCDRCGFFLKLKTGDV